jgi:RNA repair pathway DNA polymerase beta family
MDLIVEMRYGSHLYGTDTAQSDIDLKSVYVPCARDILLQCVRPTIVLAPSRPPGQKSAPGEVERETYSLQRFLGLLAEGQTMALDMLFAPDSAMTIPPAPLWREIQANAHRLVSKRASTFLGYCRRQANTYGVKGTRVAAARKALAVLSEGEARLGPAAKLSELAAELEALTTMEHIGFAERPLPGGAMLRHLDVCDHKAPFTASIKTAREMVQRLAGDYGQRALQAERNEGVDWKALSHAVRIGREAIELFETGRIVFPLRYAAHLLKIKLGELPYVQVADEIERLLTEVEAAASASGLPEAADREFIAELVARVHAQRVVDAATPPVRC